MDNTRIIEIRDRTKSDVLEKLSKYHRCLIIRPTGYGKTYLMTDLIANYGKVLYLYPAEVIAETVRDRYVQTHLDEMDAETLENIAAMKTFANVDMMTYAKLIRLTPEEMNAVHYDAIIVDEAHRAGAPRTVQALSRLLTACPNADLIGATATPNRTDSFDVASVFFSNIMSFPYTMHDAMQDGLLQKPNYCYCTYDIETDLKEAALTAGEDLKDPEVLEVLNKKLIEISRIYNMETIIRAMCDKFVADTGFMKFIVFFSSKKHMDEKFPDVCNWFHEAYPDRNIETLRISSCSRDESRNVYALQQLTAKPNTVCLIGCIDMLNMGYHVDNLTGIIMYRGTKSDIIYVQQLGRALSSGASTPALVFDIVDNLHRKAVYDLTENPNTRSLRAQKKAAQPRRQTMTPWHVDEDGVIVDDKGDPAPVQFSPDKSAILDTHGNTTSLYADPKTNRIRNGADNQAMFAEMNRITGDDVHRVDLDTPLYADGHEATYKEILAKAVAEPMSQRCRIAVNIHFRKWCEAMNVPYPITKEELDRLGTVSSKDFNRYFRHLLAVNHIDYPLQDVAELLAFGEDDSDRIPLRICAKAKNVSVRAILELLELAA